MAHEKRRVWAEDLSEQTGLPIVWDRISSVWDTAKRAWQTFDPDADVHIVVQDDAVICKDFLSSVAAFLEAVPEGVPAVLSVIDYRLHGQKQDYMQAAARGDRVWRSFASVHAVGMVLPVADIPAVLEYGEQYEKVLHDDWRIRAFYRSRGIKFAFPIPSLLQHRHSSENPTLLRGHDDKFEDRTSGNFIGQDVSGLTIDWTAKREHTDMTGRVQFRNTKTGDVLTVPVGSKAAQHFNRLKHYEVVPQQFVTYPDPEPEPVEAPQLERPPLAGPGSSRAVWQAYADHIGIVDAHGMTRTELIEACDAHTD